jgi:hypothetical protein
MAWLDSSAEAAARWVAAMLSSARHARSEVPHSRHWLRRQRSLLQAGLDAAEGEHGVALAGAGDVLGGTAAPQGGAEGTDSEAEVRVSSSCDAASGQRWRIFADDRHWTTRFHWTR